MPRRRAGGRPRRPQANRGRAWEDYLELLHRGYQARGQAVVLRTPPPVKVLGKIDGVGRFLACFTATGPPDYLGLAGGLGIAAEAKECSVPRWSLAGLPVHQAQVLDAWQTQGGVAVVLLHYLPRQQGLVLPWDRLGRRWHTWQLTKQQPGRAPPGVASLAWDDLQAIGLPFDRQGWLQPLLAWVEAGRP